MAGISDSCFHGEVEKEGRCPCSSFLLDEVSNLLRRLLGQFTHGHLKEEAVRGRSPPTMASKPSDISLVAEHSPRGELIL